MWATEVGESYCVDLLKRENRASKRLNLRSMIVLQKLPGGRWGYTSYGCTKTDCDRARKIADAVLIAVEVAACDTSEES